MWQGGSRNFLWNPLEIEKGYPKRSYVFGKRVQGENSTVFGSMQSQQGDLDGGKIQN